MSSALQPTTTREPERADSEPEGVPCPREVWRAATSGREITIRVQPDHGRAFTVTGEVTDRRKVGGSSTTYVTIQFVPDGDLAAVEIEAGKERGTWGPFRAFNWTHTRHPSREGDHAFQFIGQVTDLAIPGVREGCEDREVSH